MSEETRELLIQATTEELLLTVPSKWKITFGMLQPGERYSEGAVLRIYESDKQQRAVFRNVVSFRDLSMPLKRKLIKEESKSKRKRDNKGNEVYETETSVDGGEWVED